MNQQKLIEGAGIEIVSDEMTIIRELETRINTRRKINRSIEEANGSKNYCGEVFGLPLKDLETMQTENDHFLNKLVDLCREISPFKNVIPKHSDKYEVGAILTDSWGWEQTNIDFYCIVKRSGNWITVLPMSIKSGELSAQYLSREEEPGTLIFTSKLSRKRICINQRGEEVGFSFRNYSGGGWCRLWKGKKETSTHYA